MTKTNKYQFIPISLQFGLALSLILGWPGGFKFGFAQVLKPVRLRLLSYNIHHGEGIDRKLDLERISRVIKGVKPDLVALQEVDQKARRTGSVDQPAVLSRLTQMQIVFGPNIELQGGHYGNAILSRFPVIRQKNHRLPNFDQGEQRGVIESEINVPGLPFPLVLLATHFDHRKAGRERLESAKQINQLVRNQPERLALLAGDLNDIPGSLTLRELETFWIRPKGKALFTVPVGEPRRQIDFILYRPRNRWKVIEIKVLKEAVASDHRAILCVLEWSPAKRF
ncbi:MAG: endonuclease/exonuclease/phosphatase family protein [Planctomycetota bacterium]|nr:endonuclease/exonuclease/phosphatase family protein [Planctomycetota bacterium]